MTDRVCLQCKNQFRALNTEVNRGGAKYCSRECYYLYQPKLLEQKFKDHKMTYGSVHIWIKRKLGKPRECVDCGTTEAKLYDWANISGEYLRDLSDWKRLCRKCHIAFDDQPTKRKETLLNKYGTINYVKRDLVTGQFAKTF